MKKIFISMICLLTVSMCFFSSCKKDDSNQEEIGDVVASGEETTETYVDLGLPSGTKWKTENEKNADDPNHDLFNHYVAIAQFGKQVPNTQQWSELIDNCVFTWTDNGCNVTGPNGKSIFLPAAGIMFADGDFIGEGYGYYWTYNTYSSNTKRAYEVRFDGLTLPPRIDGYGLRECKLSVRLVCL